MNEPCFQCELDIPHVCYHGLPDARWGLHDGAIAALETANCYLRTAQKPAVQKRSPRAKKSKKPAVRSKKARR